MNEFKLKAPYKPTGDQPQAIAAVSYTHLNLAELSQLQELPVTDNHCTDLRAEESDHMQNYFYSGLDKRSHQQKYLKSAWFYKIIPDWDRLYGVRGLQDKPDVYKRQI